MAGMQFVIASPYKTGRRTDAIALEMLGNMRRWDHQALTAQLVNTSSRCALHVLLFISLSRSMLCAWLQDCYVRLLTPMWLTT